MTFEKPTSKPASPFSSPARDKGTAWLATLVVSAAALFGCKARGAPAGAGGSGPTSPTSTSSVPLPKLDPLPPLARVVSQNKESSGLVTNARLLVGHLTTRDLATVLVHWEGASGALAARVVDSGAMMHAMHATVVAPGAKEKKPVNNDTPESKHAWTTELGQNPTYIFSIAPDGFVGRQWTVELPAGSARFKAPGKYTFSVGGKLAPSEGDGLPFESAPLTVEVVEPSPADRPLHELHDIAATAVGTAFSLTSRPQSMRGIVEDAAGNRVVRFSIENNGYDRRFVEAVVSRAGVVLSIQVRNIFTCVAVGTPIETPDGARPIEDLREGDALWGVDPATRARVLTHVRAAVRSRGERLIQVAPGLRVTPRHPVMTSSGDFVPAGALVPGSEIVFGDGRTAPVGSLADLESSDVVELSVDPPNTYIAGGVVVHNKAVATPESLLAARDDWASVDFRPLARCGNRFLPHPLAHAVEP